MASTRTIKISRPARLRTRLALAFGVFALNIVTALGLLEIWFWESTHGGEHAPIGSILFTAGAIVVAVAALAGYLLAGPLARPMEKWAEAADRIGVGERDVTFPQSGGSHELARVSAAMQSMFARLTEKEDLLQERIRERTSALADATNALGAERARLAAALEGTRLAYWDLNLENGEMRLSAEWAGMLGEPPGETVTSVQALLERVPEEEHAAISERVFGAVRAGEAGRYEIDHRVRHADGRWVWVRSRGRVTARDAEGRSVRMAGTNADISPRRDQEEEQLASEERLKDVLDGVGSSICHVDLAGRILFANKRYHEFYGLEDGSAVGQRIRDVAGDEGAVAFERCVPQLLAGNEVHYDREARVQGRRVHIEIRLAPQRDELGITGSIYAMLTDVTERKAAERILQHQAHTDSITGLPNKRLFLEHLERALARGPAGNARPAVLYADLDDFKSVNARFGRDQGDMLLRQVATRYTAAVRGADTVAHIEGNAYAVLMENCGSSDDAEVVARKLVESLRAPFQLPKGELEISCSVGVALAPADGEEPTVLLRNADQAMTRAKKDGKNRFARSS